ncbi:oligosaccharyltransferase complex subunit epsilon [Tilletia horrida]|nr:oligosaccharyltransferase complex subunit epsilon [Tilletia horrida]
MPSKSKSKKGGASSASAEPTPAASVQASPPLGVSAPAAATEQSSTTSTSAAAASTQAEIPARTTSVPLQSTRRKPGNVVSSLISSYNDTTPAHLKLIDGFLVFLILTGVAQFGYCVAVTNFPFNSFISGFASTVGQFVLAASLRIQANPANTSDFPKVSPERAFADFLFGSVVLHFFVINFLG